MIENKIEKKKFIKLIQIKEERPNSLSEKLKGLMWNVAKENTKTDEERKNKIKKLNHSKTTWN